MPINNERDLERAVEEFQRLSDAPAGSPDERRRRELDAEIKAFYVQNMDELRVAKPRHE
ncbi:hypothetical protein [Azospirillum rugosum]|uniref:Uncharacterized protein n=1 Tax=Azospirillum rugosum TaxID=416170 RepID=A0ABS4SQA0_9PROT|nr:hypothetical protein [Azospirillum rugosum]MBP2294734.1 hypothetical protein [Azospirillum rugosum]MDQ0527977.1 hypothetical protein [Azospirillum rugosum]